MTSAPLSGSPVDQPGGPSTRPPLLRSSTDRMAGGVCGGLAEYSGIDSLLWRVGFVGLTLAGGAGIVVYLLLWVLMPSAATASGEEPSPVERLAQRLHTAVNGALGRRD